jgi:hypothetical protein
MLKLLVMREKANQNHNEMALCTIKGGRNLKDMISVEKMETSYIAGETVIWYSHFGRVWQFLRK